MTELEVRLTEAAALREQLAALAPVKDRLDVLKYEIQELMDAEQMDKTQGVAGVYALKSQRVSVQVDDRTKLEAWLTENEYELEDYTTLDTKKITQLQEVVLGESGELLPGTSVQKTEFISLRAVPTSKSHLKELAKGL